MTLKIVLPVTLLALCATLVSGSVNAVDGATLYKQKTCFSCHGIDANTLILPIYPKLADQKAEYAFSQMNDIKSGTCSNGQTAAMKGVMQLLSEQEMKAIVGWLSTL